MLEKLRNRFYWLFDYIKGGRVKKHYNQIKFILENYGSTEAEKLRSNNLKNLLNHAVEHVPFYKSYSKTLDLQSFPVINKAIIREQLDQFQSSFFKGEKLYKMTTSGSSGTPFTTIQNKEKKDRNTADTIYLKEQVGFMVGGRLYYVRKWFKLHQRSGLVAKLQNIVMVNVTEFDDDYLSNFIRNLQSDKSKKAILAYSSALCDICLYLDRIDSEPLDTEIECIIAMAEGISDSTRASLQKYFNAPVYIRYSNNENGILSLQLSEKNHHLQINWASYYVEVLKLNSDEPAIYGELGRVVVTDLFNYQMPFIRYDTGDLAVMVEDDTFNKAPAFSEVNGRKMDAIYNTRGQLQSTFIVFHLEQYPEIKQFQFIQEGRKEYCVKLNVSEVNIESETEIIKMFKSYLGQDAEVRFLYEDSIPQLSSGKRRLVVNNFS